MIKDNGFKLLMKVLNKFLIKYKLETEGIMFISSIGHIQYLGSLEWFFLDKGKTIKATHIEIANIIKFDVPHSNTYDINLTFNQNEAKKLFR